MNYTYSMCVLNRLRYFYHNSKQFGFVALGAASDILGFRRLPAGEVGARVDACTGRWAMFWLLGFAGPILVAVFGKPMAFFAFFGLLKAWWEIARVFTKGGVRRPTATYP